MTYDHELTLIGPGIVVKDEIGNETVEPSPETTVLCGLRSATRSEFYGAAAAQLRPELVFLVHAFEYSGQRNVRFEERDYRVLRTYGEGTEEIELTCERV